MELLSNLLSFSLSAYGIMNFHRDLRKLAEQSTAVKEAKIFTASSLTEHFLEILNKSQNTDANKQDLVMKGFIEGIVDSTMVLGSALKKNEKLVYKMSFIDKIYDNDRFINRVALVKKIPKSISVEQTPFFLLKDYESNIFCKVLKNNNVNAKNALELIDFQTIFHKKISIFKRILSLLYIFFHILSLFLEDKLNYRGIKVGESKVELGIKVNGYITVYGEIIFNALTKTLRIEKPEYLLKDKSVVLEEILSKIKRKKFLLIVYYLVNFYCGYKLFKKLFALISNKFKKTKFENSNKMNKFKDCEKMYCVICYTEVRNIILNPCNHLAICNQCFHNIKNDKMCPICKNKFSSYVEIFAK